jgi:putative ABC transport system substrate-binding protein
MRRREFITVLGGAAAGWPLAARAQQPAMPVIGYFFPGMPEQTGRAAAFRKGLGEYGVVEGRNVAIESRFASNDSSRSPEFVADLVRRKVTVIAATGGETGALAARAATTTIPIVFEIGGDPVELGLVASFNRPGGNVTGVTAMNLELDGKRLAILAELVPGAARIGVLMTSPLIAINQARIAYIQAAAVALGRQIEVLPTASSREIDEVFASLAQKQIGALLVSAQPTYYSLRAQIATTAARHGIPILSGDPALAEAGALVSYGSAPEDNWRLVGVYVGRILKGEKPADLPVVRPTKFEFVINLQTARLLRIQIPPTLLALADRVIE